MLDISFGTFNSSYFLSLPLVDPSSRASVPETRRLNARYRAQLSSSSFLHLAPFPWSRLLQQLLQCYFSLGKKSRHVVIALAKFKKCKYCNEWQPVLVLSQQHWYRFLPRFTIIPYFTVMETKHLKVLNVEEFFSCSVAI